MVVEFCIRFAWIGNPDFTTNCETLMLETFEQFVKEFIFCETFSRLLIMDFAQAMVATVDNFCAQAGCVQPCKVTHHQAKEADIHALSELKRALDRKVYTF